MLETIKNMPQGISLPFLVLGLLLALGLGYVACSGRGPKSTGADEKSKANEEHHNRDEVELSAEAMKAAKIETLEVAERSVTEGLRVTGSVETNQPRTQQATPLVSGRVERVNVALGDRVVRGATIAVIASPQIAEMHGKLHEAETAMAIAERNFERVQKTENRVAVLQAKARLEETEASLRRTRKLIELGAGAGKDLIAAETAYKTARAEYEFQSNIALNKELAESRAAVDTARVDVKHMRDQLAALGAPVSVGESDDHDHDHDTSLISLRAPISGTVTERLVNAGAGVEAGKPLFTIADISKLWVIGNVPEARANPLRPGLEAMVRTSDGEQIAGRVTYIDPMLKQETRTVNVRVEIANPGGRLKIGSFVEIDFKTNAVAAEPVMLIPEEAVQRIGERAIVFVPITKPDSKNSSHFAVREIELGGGVDGMRRVTAGLKTGERIVVKGGFTLKAQLMKGELGEGH
jgi:membrane fusion protein, heavy metal efflux system